MAYFVGGGVGAAKYSLPNSLPSLSKHRTVAIFQSGFTESGFTSAKYGTSPWTVKTWAVSLVG
jgi:hypothetical protein